ncbi:MAG: NADH-quinone oxidoreductase subunit C [Deltaproteobacteria bacterium]|jgi:NADH-quinone oxidoreductase subunit C|nr:NADH-quinone oxidoreductase subunit C [Deltaproteobacteria bacterium]
MPSLDSRIARWRQIGTLSISRHDFRVEGLLLSAVVALDKLLEFVKTLYIDGFTLLDISTLQAKEGFLITYHFDSINDPGRLALRVLVPTNNPVVPSLNNIFQGAEWHERESTDFFGVRFSGNPNPVPLLLPDDFDGPPPLLKSPESLAPLSALGLFGTIESAEPAFAALIDPKADQG